MISPPADSSDKKPGGPYRKPQADVFTVLLMLALIAILLGILFLYFENAMYEWDYQGGPTASALCPSPLALRPSLPTPAPWPLTPESSTDAPTTLPLFQFRLGG